MTKHTPTPWTEFIVNSNFNAGICTKGGKPVAMVCHQDSEEEANANVEFIVHAVNSHDALLDALKGIVRSVSMNCQEHGPLPGAVKTNIRKAEEAIAQAEGK